MKIFQEDESQREQMDKFLDSNDGSIFIALLALVIALCSVGYFIWQLFS
ncbi:hypothetical protein [Actinomyces vulturis]|nr:hypothetical protein [Actinomyces vulturis]